MISFEMEDLIGVLKGLTPYFIVIGVLLAAAIVITVLVKKYPKAKKKMLRGETWMAALLGIAVTVNAICLGPMSALLSLIGGEPTPSRVSDALAAEAEASALKIAEEGFVLLENEGIPQMRSQRRGTQNCVYKRSPSLWLTPEPCVHEADGKKSGVLPELLLL